MASDPQSPISQELILEQQEMVKVQEIIASNTKSGKKLKVAGSTNVGRQQVRRGSKSNKPVMRFDENLSTSNEAVTVLGDNNM